MAELNKRRVLSVLVENKSGVLARVVALISRRGFNIDSLSVGPTEDQTRSRITILSDVDDEAWEQITKQLNKLIVVHKISDLTDGNPIERELVLFKVEAPAERRSEVIEIASLFRANIVDVGATSLTIEATGSESKLSGLEDLLRSYGIKEITRTGKIAISRNSKGSS
jgi:acetolactate synthase-1/3 small subunit